MSLKCVVSKEARLECEAQSLVSRCIKKYTKSCDISTIHLLNEEEPRWIMGKNCRDLSNGVCTIDQQASACAKWGCYSPSVGEGSKLIADRKGNPLVREVVPHHIDPKTKNKKRDWSEAPYGFSRECRDFAKKVTGLSDDDRAGVTARCYKRIFLRNT